MSRVHTYWVRALRVSQRYLVRPQRDSRDRPGHSKRASRRISKSAWAHEAHLLGSRRLEPRRLLDAALPGVLVSTFDGASFEESSLDEINDAIQTDRAQVGESPDRSLDEPEASLDAGLFSPLHSNETPHNVVVVLLGQHHPSRDIAESETAYAYFSFRDPNIFDSHTVQVDWGDESEENSFSLTVGQRWGVVSHQYLDDNPSGTPWDVNHVQITVADNHGASGIGSGEIRVNNVGPSNLQLLPLDVISENSISQVQLTFEDPGTLDAHHAQVDWGDGAPVETWNVASGDRNLQASHTYADNGIYTIQVQLFDDDLGVVSGRVQQQVKNVAPTLTLVGDQVSAEGSRILLPGLAHFTDPGFDNPQNNQDPSNGGETAEFFNYQIDWGDGSSVDVGTALIDRQGSPGVPTMGSFGGDHLFADNGIYTVLVSLQDDDGGFDRQSFQVTVSNVDPILTGVLSIPAIKEGEGFTLAGLGVELADPGFDNPDRPLPTGSSVETFSAVTVDWGDGSVPASLSIVHRTNGGPGRPTTAEFEHSAHVYADNGRYTVTVLMADDDNLAANQLVTRTFTIDVLNVAPTLTLVGDQVSAEGSRILLPGLAHFTDPGFDNPQNNQDPSNGGETAEFFNYQIDWGDGSSVDVGTALIDRQGSPGVPTMGSFGGDHLFADNGIYTVLVSLQDDDGGFDRQSFQVTVSNVDPILTGVLSIPAIKEGEGFTLAGLGVELADPGFDNPDRPLPTGSSVETFSAVTVDWGDGSVPASLSIVHRTNGGPGRPTTAEFEHSAHVYADNGRYTVTVLMADDDNLAANQLVTRTFTIDVLNVAPTLTLTSDRLVLDEGSLLTIANLGTFTDPGFDNSLGSPVTTETFSYSIDWGDGTVETVQLPVMVVPGSPEVLTIGSLEASHFYRDNNVNALHQIIDYTVIVRLSDDDGGTTQGSFDVTVNNVDPTLMTLNGTDIDRLGETTLSGSFFDPGADTFIVLIDWQDGSVEQVPLGGSTPKDFSVTHRYFGPPDPLNPAADVDIQVRLLDDDLGFDTGLVSVSNPGDGTRPVRIDTTPQVPRLVFPKPVVAESLLDSNTVSMDIGGGADFSSAVGDTKATGEHYFLLRVFTPQGEQGAGYRLKADSLQDIPGLFRTLPDNHYAIYLVRPETGTYRLVLEVNVRNGKVIDTGDDSEGARDRPPTEAVQGAIRVPVEQQPVEQQPVEQQSNEQQPDEQRTDKQDPQRDGLSVDPAKPSNSALPTTPETPVEVTNAETSRALEADRRLAGATPIRWRRLRGLAR
ncbi:MAG: hypothetical protein ABGX16_05905 [Pirellulales bacterium]